MRLITPASAAEDAHLCSRLYQAEAVHFVRRAENFAEHFRQEKRFRQAEAWIVEMDEKPAAYLILNVPWEQLRAPKPEVRIVDEYAGSRLALATAFARIMTDYATRELRIIVPWQDADLIILLQDFGARSEASALPDHTLRLINFPALMADLGPYVEARLGPIPLRGLRFEQTGAYLASPGAEYHTDRCVIERGKDRLDRDVAAMTRLVMCGAQAEDSLPGALSEIVEALFPLPSFLPGLNYH